MDYGKVFGCAVFYCREDTKFPYVYYDLTRSKNYVARRKSWENEFLFIASESNKLRLKDFKTGEIYDSITLDDIGSDDWDVLYIYRDEDKNIHDGLAEL
jgi:hypothetical protein